jgi:hypothetical protein
MQNRQGVPRKNTTMSDREFRVNEQCIVGLPACGYGFESSRLCFLARPADPEFQLEHEILELVLRERNYQIYAALHELEPGSFAFCTKICSRIITSHFCIVLLNPSKHATAEGVKISNPNVHLEYGMMLSFHKHVIPMQREEDDLPFNIYPLDTVKYRPDNFRQKAEEAIDDAIVRYQTKEPAGHPFGAASEVLRYISLRGLRFTDTTSTDGAAFYGVGSPHGFHLLDDADALHYFGFFHEEEPIEIVLNTRLLIAGLHNLFNRVERTEDVPGAPSLTPEQRATALKIIAGSKIILLVPEEAPVDSMTARLTDYMSDTSHFSIEVIKPSHVSDRIRKEYESISL